MRAALLLVLVGAGSARAGPASDAFLESETVTASPAQSVPTTPGDPLWMKAPVASFRVSAQRSVRLNDKRANELLGQPGFGEVRVRALASATELGVLLTWNDASRNVLPADDTNAYPDAAAIEIPSVFGAGHRLPYVGMGDVELPVRLYLQRKAPKGTQANEYVAAGFGSLTRVPRIQATMAMEYDEQLKLWRAVFVRPLQVEGHALTQSSLVPMAFAVWDGARSERGGYKQLSAWRFVLLPRPALDAAYVKYLSWGYAPGDLGDPAKGRAIAETVCIACHRLPGKTVASPGIAPDLFDIGAIASPIYLRESITNPNGVIIHAVNPNAHYSKASPPDKNGAYPNADAYQWSTTLPGGKIVSKMPPFTMFTPEQVGDLIAYLKTLDGTKEPEPR
ncbi:MAG: c-type cytochrome [Myxococcales bacterium]|nr:c-type cytochrome [Myxococcales bacterium]